MIQMTEIYIKRFQRKTKTEKLVMFFEMLVGATQSENQPLVDAVLSRTRDMSYKNHTQNESHVFNTINSADKIDNDDLFALYKYAVLTLCVVLSREQRQKIYELAREYKEAKINGSMNPLMHDEFISKIRLLKK